MHKSAKDFYFDNNFVQVIMMVEIKSQNICKYLLVMCVWFVKVGYKSAKDFYFDNILWAGYFDGANQVTKYL